METTKNEVQEIFEKSGALLKGHFVLRSGLHSEYYFQCARACEDLTAVSRLSELLIKRLGNIECDTIIAPAMGGLVIGQEIARQLRKRFIFAEKQDNKLVLRRGFKFKPNERVLVVEDVITKGGRAQESINIVKENGGTPVALAVLVDRSQGNAKFEIPHSSLYAMSFPTYEPSDLPEHLKAVPVSKPGS